MKITEGNILDVDTGIICQQVNCKGVMGAGLAFQIKKEWPVVFNTYRERYKKVGLSLGEAIIVNVDRQKSIYVANICGQDAYGRGRVFTDYNALEYGLNSVKNWAGNRQIYLPFGMGCGLAGGDWNTVLQIISKITPNAIIIKYKR